MIRPQSIRYTLFIGLYVILHANAFAQSTSLLTPKINIPTSPEAAMLGRFGDIPIGYYTGTADVSIPFYTVKEGSVEIPITLRYHSSGIKVEDQATWVGLGWDLSPEGAITQEIRGQSDDVEVAPLCFMEQYPLFAQRFAYISNAGFLPQWGRSTEISHCLESYISLPPPQGWTNSYEAPRCLVDQLVEGRGQPDIYNYNFCGHSGKFYIHPYTHQLVVTEKNDQVYFEKVNSTLIKATTLDGAVFTFDAVETAHGGIVNEYTGKTFKVTNIQLLTGRSISFIYTDQSYLEQTYSQAAEIIWFSGLPVTSNTSYTYHNKKALSRIITSDAIIDFNLSGREDINVESTDNIQKLSSIDITSRLSNKKLKTVQFTYSYFPYNNVGGGNYVSGHEDAFGKRLKLDAVQEIGYDDAGTSISTKPPYSFNYDMSVTMPLKVSFAKDFWGYYNGIGNTTLLPDLTFFDYFNQDEYKISNQAAVYPYNGANRYTDNTKAGAYLLKKVTYPTSGYTEFEYEPNSFGNQFIPNKLGEEGAFKFYTVSDNSIGGTPSQTFKIGKELTIHFENHINNGLGNYNHLTPYTYSQMLGCYIRFSKVKTVNGNPVTSVLKQWDLTTVLGVDFEAHGGVYWPDDIRVTYDPDPSVEYKVEANFPDELNNVQFASIAGVACSFSFHDETQIPTTESVQCGMRIKSIKNYTEPGKLASHKLIKYYDGKLLNKFRPLTVYPCNHENTADVTDGYGREYIAFYKRITVSGNDFGTGGGNPIGYGKVEEIELANDVATNGKKVYYYRNEVNTTQQGAPNVPYITNGELNLEETYDNTNTKVMERLYLYTDLPAPPRFLGINVVRLATGTLTPCQNYTDASPFTTSYYDNMGADYITSGYGYNVYAVNARYSKPGTITTRLYSPGSVITKTQTYTYNDEGSVRTETTNNSKGEQLVKKYYYPNDFRIGSDVDNYMNGKHNTGTPVIIEQYTGTTFLSRQKTEYGPFPGAPTYLPKYIYSQKGANPEEKRVTINGYDGLGNVTLVTEEGNIPVSYLWNEDKSHPIAKVSNAQISEVAYTSFENGNADGNWTISDNNRNNQAKISGSQSFDLVSGRWVSTEVSSGKQYILSYWSTNGAVTVTANGAPVAVSSTGSSRNGWTYYEHTLPNTAVSVSVTGNNAAIDELRLYPADAEMETWCYSPLKGVITACDKNNRMLYYEYDDQSRLAVVRDQDGNIIKTLQYNYKQ